MHLACVRAPFPPAGMCGSKAAAGTLGDGATGSGLTVRIRGTRGQARAAAAGRGGTAPGPQSPQRGAHRSSRGAPAKAQAARRDVRAGGADVQAERRVSAAQIRELAVGETPRRRGARADDAVIPLAVQPPAQHAHRLNE